MNHAEARRYIQAFDFRHLFLEVLGWDNHPTPLRVEVEGEVFNLQGIAHKRGMVALWLASPGAVPPYAMRRKIERQVARAHREHLIVYTGGGRQEQVWQWVRQEPGKPLASREHRYHAGQAGDSLLQKLEAVAFGLDEEGSLTLVDVTSRVRAAFDVERVTRRFYDQFKRERDAFEKFLTGIPDAGIARWYVSVMLDRLMFIYFIEKKGFLNRDPDYLRTKLFESRFRGADRYYRDILCPLFFQGFAQPADRRLPEVRSLLGDVPYLNGGIFQPHEIEERYGQAIDLPDAAFERLFAFFEQYQWHLDDRPLRQDNEINPDVLGYIFEKYVNQKQMGAYYTKEDITGYISRNTVIPFLFDEARKHCRRAFEGEGAVWRLLRDDPDRYIYPAMQRGALLPLPPEIAAGIGDVGQRGLWNTPAAADLALPTEIWRETVARRQRCQEVRDRLAAGQVRDINDLITYNLDIQQFAQDVVETCDDPELLRAFWKAIRALSCLDLTSGSGAFLFAALNVLEPLYEACLDRMQAFVADLEPGASPQKYRDFRDVLAQVERHPNRKYYVFKSIIVDNLYGVDIMAEAVEIAKLRLFLKLVAQVERVEDVEPLPDIDFNIRAGNALVGFTTREQVQTALRSQQVGAGVQQDRMLFGEDQARLRQIEEQAEAVDRLFGEFRRMQTAHDMSAYGQDFAETKAELRRRLRALEDELNRALAGEYGVDAGQPAAYERWLASHQPFHWFVEFYGIMRAGGFSVTLGNPPWVEYAKVRTTYQVRDYQTEPCGNLYGLCTERCLGLRAPAGWLSFIVQLPIVRSPRMETVRELLMEKSGYLTIAPFDDRPGKLFEGLEHCRSAIFLSRGVKGAAEKTHQTTHYQRWPTECRPFLFGQIEYIRMGQDAADLHQFPKYGNAIHQEILKKVDAVGTKRVGHAVSTQPTQHFVFYQEAMQYWAKVTVGLPYYAKNGVVGTPPHGRHLYFHDSQAPYAACALLNSSLFYLFFITYGDCFHLNHSLATGFPVPAGLLSDASLIEAGRQLVSDLNANAQAVTIRTKDGDEIAYAAYYGGRSKPLIDTIDALLARQYGLTDEELDFIINYDIKYRMGDELLDDEGEEE